jgi:hypothetical protein
MCTSEQDQSLRRAPAPESPTGSRATRAGQHRRLLKLAEIGKSPLTYANFEWHVTTIFNRCIICTLRYVVLT